MSKKSRNEPKVSAFFVTTVEPQYEEGKLPFKSHRTPGWFPTFEMANLAVENNYGDIWEGNFTFCVIEEIEWGFYQIPPKSEQWYQFDKNTNKYKQIPKPEIFKTIGNFSIG